MTSPFDREINFPFGLEQKIVLERSTIYFGISLFLFRFLDDISFDDISFLFVRLLDDYVLKKNCFALDILLIYYLPSNLNITTRIENDFNVEISINKKYIY